MKYSKAMLEVWEWKEAVYDEIKELSNDDIIENGKKISEKFLSEAGIELETIESKNKERIRVSA